MLKAPWTPRLQACMFDRSVDLTHYQSKVYPTTYTTLWCRAGCTFCTLYCVMQWIHPLQIATTCAALTAAGGSASSRPGSSTARCCHGCPWGPGLRCTRCREPCWSSFGDYVTLGMMSLPSSPSPRAHLRHPPLPSPSTSLFTSSKYVAEPRTQDVWGTSVLFTSSKYVAEPRTQDVWGMNM
jgi:hypothetical protein